MLGRLRSERGYSLIELLVTMSLLGVVLGAITTVFVSGSKAELDMNRRFQAQQNARLALSQLRTELHSACGATATSTTLLLNTLDTTQNPPACGATPSIAWCTYASTLYPGRLSLYETAASSCPGTAPAATMRADGLVASGYTFFSFVTGSSGQHDSVAVDIPVRATPSTVTTGGLYELSDTIVLRNSARHP